MAMEIGFAGGMTVEARYKGFVTRTDQPVSLGGSGSAPSPFDLFLASVGTCAGYYALRFCQERQLSTEGMGITLDFERGERGDAIETIRLALTLPEGFPEKYRGAILRAIDHCAVKRHLERPPRVESSIAVPVLAVGA